MKNYQIFASPEAVQGKQICYLYRDLEKQATSDAVAMAFVTQNERTSQKTANSTATKDGSIRTPGTDSTEITATAVYPKNDPALELLNDCYDNDKLVEVWEVNLAEPVDGKENQFNSVYMLGYITQLRITSAAQNNAEASITVGISGGKATGPATLTRDQQEVAALVFKDTVKAPAEQPKA